VDFGSRDPVGQAADCDVGREGQSGRDDESLTQVDPMEDVDLVDDVNDDGDDKEFADVFPAVPNELTPVAEFGGEEMPAECASTFPSISQTCS
jgi:hypothetical protein